MNNETNTNKTETETQEITIKNQTNETNNGNGDNEDNNISENKDKNKDIITDKQNMHLKNMKKMLNFEMIKDKSYRKELEDELETEFIPDIVQYYKHIYAEEEQKRNKMWSILSVGVEAISIGFEQNVFDDEISEKIIADLMFSKQFEDSIDEHEKHILMRFGYDMWKLCLSLSSVRFKYHLKTISQIYSLDN